MKMSSERMIPMRNKEPWCVVVIVVVASMLHGLPQNVYQVSLAL